MLVAWLQRFFVLITRKHPLAIELLKTSEAGLPVMSESRARVMAAGRPLLLAAQRTHEVRGDLTIEQIADLLVAIAAINGDADYLNPILQTALDGIRLPT